MTRWEQGQLIFCALDPVQGQGKDLARTKLALPTQLTWSVSPEGARVAVASNDQLREQVRILDLRNGVRRVNGGGLCAAVLKYKQLQGESKR